MTKANSKSIERLKEDGRMYIKELFEIMKPEIDEAINEAVSKKDRDNVIRMLKLNMSYDNISQSLDIPIDTIKKIEEESSILV